jgi:hypothetical protein
VLLPPLAFPGGTIPNAFDVTEIKAYSCDLYDLRQCDQKIERNFSQFLEKVAKNVYIEA